MLPAIKDWTVSVFGAMASICTYLAAALQAIVAVSWCNETLLSISLVFTDSLTFYLPITLKMNALLRLTLAGVLFSQEELDRRWTSCSAWPPSQTSRHSSCRPLCSGGGRRVRWSQSALHGVPALRRCLLSVCMAVLAFIHVALSALLTLSTDFRPRVSTVRT